MNILSKPLKRRYVACHNGKDVFHFVVNEPWHVTVSGQPFMEDYATKNGLEKKCKTFAMTAKNRVDLETFKSETVNEVVIGDVK